MTQNKNTAEIIELPLNAKGDRRGMHGNQGKKKGSTSKTTPKQLADNLVEVKWEFYRDKREELLLKLPEGSLDTAEGRAAVFTNLKKIKKEIMSASMMKMLNKMFLRTYFKNDHAEQKDLATRFAGYYHKKDEDNESSHKKIVIDLSQMDDDDY